MTNEKRNRQLGQALPEMIVVFPLVVILVMAVMQIALIYRGKATLNNATFHAARTGALNHGFIKPMKKAFFSKMAAIGQINPNLKSDTTTEGLYDSPNLARALATQVALESSHFYEPLEIVWPTKDVFNHFAISFNSLVECGTEECPFSDVGGKFRLNDDSVYQIPLENQDARDQSMQTIQGRKVDLQDANLLMIKSMYCYDLEIPVANFIIWRTLKVTMGTDKDWATCQSLNQQYGGNRFVMPIVGRSVVRMQSGFRCEDDEENGVDCKNI